MKGREVVAQASSLLNPTQTFESSEPSLTLGSRVLSKPKIAEIVQKVLVHFEGERYWLAAWCIMANHVHVVLTPLGEHGLSDILHSWKSFASNEINKALGSKGTLWERESFDHLIRSPEHFSKFVTYTEENPVKAGLCERPKDWVFSSRGADFQPAPIEFVNPREIPFIEFRGRGELPHLEKQGCSFFVTFCLADAVESGKSKVGESRLEARTTRKQAGSSHHKKAGWKPAPQEMTRIPKPSRERNRIMKEALLQTNCPNLDLIARGKVRDIYDLGDRLLLVASDRISTFDVVFPNGVPDKGRILTQISRFWFEKCAHVTPNHIISFDMADFPAEAQAYADQLEGRTMLCEKTTPLEIECVVRGYLDGSAWSEYQENNGQVASGHALPSGLRQRSQLPEPIFTPATKAQTGHDINITEEQAAEIVGREIFDAARSRSLALYTYARDFLAEKKITLCDTKFEFGQRADGSLILIDEALTPDSSRFMVADSYSPDAAPISFDKQFVRDWVVATGWQKTPPAPVIPDEIIEQTRRRYLEVFQLITGTELG